MKRILFLFNILFAVVLVAQAQPKITFDKNVQELGYVLWRNPVTITYNFTNTGDKPLVISKVTANGETTITTVQDILDQLLPGLLALVLTLIVSKMLKKNMSPIAIIFILFIVGIVGYGLGILS